jgi:hypothetical protein
MSLTITIHQTEHGRFRADLLGTTLEADSLDALMEDVTRRVVSRDLKDVLAFEENVDVRIHRAGTRADDDADFEADLDHVLTKNAELYRRLAR